MNYNELLILHYMPHFKLFKTSHSQFLPFLSQKTLKIRRISHLLKNTVFFLFCFVFWKMSQRQESSVILWKCVLVRDYVGNTFYNFLPIHWTDLFYFRLLAISMYSKNDHLIWLVVKSESWLDTRYHLRIFQQLAHQMVA